MSDTETLQKQIDGLKAAIATERQNTATARGERDAALASVADLETKYAERDRQATGFEAQAQQWEAERQAWQAKEAEFGTQRTQWERRDALIGMGITTPEAVKVASAMYPGEDGGAFGDWLGQQTDAPWLKGYLPQAAAPATPTPEAPPVVTPTPAAAPAAPAPAPPSVNGGVRPAPPVATGVTTKQIMGMTSKDEIIAHMRSLRGEA